MRDTLIFDLRFALRQAWKHRGSTLAAFVALTAGIGGTTAMFTVVSGVLLRPLPVRDAARITRISEVDTRTGREMKVSMTDFVDWKARLRSFSSMALYRNSQGNLAGRRMPERVRVVECDPSLLGLLGIFPARGRDFSPEQKEPGHANQVLLTWSFWQNHFGGEDVLGKQIVIDEKAYTVVGVLPPLLMIFGDEQVWLPLEFDFSRLENSRGYHRYYALGRVRDHVSLQQANDELRGVATSLATEYPSRNEAVSASAKWLRDSIMGDYGRALILLFGFVAAVLLIACVNVASLSLAGASARHHEISIRVAIGATRIRLFRQMLTESVLLSSVATIAGIGVAIGLVRVVTHLSIVNIPLGQNIQVDWRVLLFSAAIALLTGIGFGLAPATRASFLSVGDALKQTSVRATDSRSQRSVKRLLVFVQAAVAALLLVVSGLLLRSFVKAAHIDPGFAVDHLLTLRVSLPASRLDFAHPGKVGLFARTVLAKIRDIPGIEDAAITSNVPFTGTGGGAGVLVEGEPQPASPFSAPYAQWTLVSPGYFRAMRIPLLEGRYFDEHDRQDEPAVAIVNQAFVKQFLHGQDPSKERIALASNPSNYLQIVGVAGDVHQSSIEKTTIPEVYFSINQLEDSWLAIAVRTQGDPMQYVTSVRNAVQRVDPQIAVFLPKTMEQIIKQQRGWRVLETSLVSSFAAIAMLLAAFGTYAVISYSITQRASEIGIRMALGATDKDILKSFTLQGAMPAISGAASGILLGFAVAHVSATLLYGVSPDDLASYAAAVLTLALVAIVASYFPARRAALLDPARTLRYE